MYAADKKARQKSRKRIKREDNRAGRAAARRKKICGGRAKNGKEVKRGEESEIGREEPPFRDDSFTATYVTAN